MLYNSDIKTNTAKVGRIALRVEGDQWVAYYAKPGTMDGAIKLGSIYFAVAKNKEYLCTQFKELMKAIVSEYINDTFGERPTWTEEQAPEHERAGRA